MGAHEDWAETRLTRASAPKMNDLILVMVKCETMR